MQSARGVDAVTALHVFEFLLGAFLGLPMVLGAALSGGRKRP